MLLSFSERNRQEHTLPKATVRANARTLPEDASKQEAKPASAEQIPLKDLLDLSDSLNIVHNLLDAAYMAAGSLPSGVGRDPLSSLLDVVTDKLGKAQADLDAFREAAQ